MTRTNIARAMLNSLLAEHFENVFYRQGFSSYPRCVYEIKRINRENGINDYILTLDVYDKNTSDCIDSMLDAFENSAEQFMYSTTDKSYLKIYTAGAERTQITDEDKNICHTQVKYSMKIID